MLRLEQGGQSTISDDDYIEGAPELMVEIVASSASYDFHDKLQVYRRNSVGEYLIWRTDGQQFAWFRLKNGLYEPLVPDADGVCCSVQFPGLWLAVNELLAQNLAAVLATLHQGLAKSEHQVFVAQLKLKTVCPPSS